MNKWDARFLGLAKHIAGWSKDPSTGVGAIVVDKKNRVVSLGFNGLPRGVEDSGDRLHNRETKYELVVHAEANALLFASRPVDGCTLYVWPLPPCSRCAAKIIQAGITRVVCPPVPDSVSDRWAESNLLAFEILDEAGVEYSECS
jgi:dCMP deaminase